MSSSDSSAYWAERAQRNEERTNRRTEAQVRQLREQYQKATAEIQEKIEAFYGRYAAEQQLSYQEAKKLLTKSETKHWEKSLGEYLAEIKAQPDSPLKEQLQAQLDARAYASRISRLDALKAQIELELDSLALESEWGLHSAMKGVLEEEYLRKTYDIQCRAGQMFPFARLDKALVEETLFYPWSGADFSQRLWQNKESLIYHLRQLLTQGIIQGKGSVELSRALQEKMQSAYAASERLLRTELSRIHNTADQRAYKAAGIRQYEFMATLQEVTCETCGQLDGQVFDVDEAQPGLNFPPIHPHCRCCTIEHDPDEWKDWAAIGEPMPKTMTYKDWLETQDAAQVVAKRKKAYGRKADRKQFANYKAALGDRIPKTLEEFQNIKYNEPEKWKLLQVDKTRRERLAKDPSLALPEAKTATAADSKFTGYLFDPDNTQGWAKGQALTKRLGYSIENWEELRKEILQGASLYPVKRKMESQYGEKYEQYMILYGLKNRPANVLVGWLLTPKEGVKLTTAYIKELKKDD